MKYVLPAVVLLLSGSGFLVLVGVMVIKHNSYEGFVRHQVKPVRIGFWKEFRKWFDAQTVTFMSLFAGKLK